MKKLLVALAFGVVVLPSCGGELPIPIPSPGEADPYVCGESLSGYIRVEDPITDNSGNSLVVVKYKVQTTRSPQRRLSTTASLVETYNLTSVSLKQDGFSGFATSQNLAKLAEDDNVQYVTEIGRKSVPPIGGVELSSSESPHSPAASTPWHKDRTDQRALPLDSAAFFPSDGSGVFVFVVDTGVNCDQIDGKCIEGYSAYGGRPTDGHGHGTFVAGEIADSFYGISPGVTIVAVKVLTDQGSGTDQAVRSGWDWVTQYVNDNQLAGKAVLSASLGGNVAPFIDEGVCLSNAAGVANVVAAGNSGDQLRTACDGSPSRVDVAFTVGASDRNDGVASFSQFGKCVDIHAPGVDVDSVNGEGWNGTSMATPCVSAVIAQRLSLGEAAESVITRATKDVLSGVRGDAPNLLLYGGS